MPLLLYRVLDGGRLSVFLLGRALNGKLVMCGRPQVIVVSITATQRIGWVWKGLTRAPTAKRVAPPFASRAGRHATHGPSLRLDSIFRRTICFNYHWTSRVHARMHACTHA